MKNLLIGFTLLLFLASSCVKEPIEPNAKPLANIDTSLVTMGLYVLNEGLFNLNNSTLTWFSYADEESVTGFFEQQNGRSLGDTGNDIAIYGSKMYVVINVSSQVEVVNPLTGKSIKQIPFFNGDKPRQPRSIAFHGSKAFVCSFDGTVAVIDTASLEIEQLIEVGRNPDGIAVSNNKVYVSNSGGLDAPNYDNTVSVIDIETMTEVKRIDVGMNPYSIVPDGYGDLYVVSRGNYGDVKSSLKVIDSNTDEVKHTFPNIEALSLSVEGDTAYVYYYDYTTGSGSHIMLIDVKNEAVLSTSFIADGTTITTAFGIAVDRENGDVFISDAKGFVNTGEVVCFDQYGYKKYSFTAGLNPGKMVFLTKRVISNTDEFRYK